MCFGLPLILLRSHSSHLGDVSIPVFTHQEVRAQKGNMRTYLVGLASLGVHRQSRFLSRAARLPNVCPSQHTWWLLRSEKCLSYFPVPVTSFKNEVRNK